MLNLKELEKWGPKKGIVLQTVKDVNQSLIDDNLVETDKIGAGAFFWALPSKGFQVVRPSMELTRLAQEPDGGLRRQDREGQG